jgi:hypothetical protein
MKVRTLQTLKDPTGDSELVIPEGTVLEVEEEVLNGAQYTVKYQDTLVGVYGWEVEVVKDSNNNNQRG